jgi:hypothetical protein
MAAWFGALLCACATVKSEPTQETGTRGADDEGEQDAGGQPAHDPHDQAGDGDGDDDPGDGDDGAPPDEGDGDDPDQPLDEPDAGMPPPQPSLALPFAVDDYFVSSGYMGDAMVDPAALTMLPAKAGDDATCGDDRASVLAKGSCHQVTYHPSTVSGAPGWAGVFWQANVNDWGALPGERVQAGATRLVFSAKGKVGGEVVTFGVGGIDSAGMPHHDSFDQQIIVTLTNQWKEYEISLSAVSYSEVLGGFRWTAAKGAADIQFNIDDIRWE